MDRPSVSVKQAAESLLPSCVASPVGRPSSPGCGTSMTPLSGNAFTFCDMDLLESGGARITLSSSYLQPQPRKQKKFRTCTLKRHKFGSGEEQSFWLYDDKRSEFMLSAKKIGSTFYISQYEDFPAVFEGNDEPSEHAMPKATHCCVLRLDTKSKVYRLFNRSCEGCDSILAKHTCGPRTRINSDRQLLAEVKHMLEPVACGDSWTECNATKVKIPNVYADKSRDVWCLRQMAPVIHPATSPGRALRKANSAPVPREAKDDVACLHEEGDPRVEEDEPKRFRIPVKQLQLEQMVSPLKRYNTAHTKSSPMNNNQEEEEEEEKEEDEGSECPVTVDDEASTDGSVDGSKAERGSDGKRIVCGTHNGACLLKSRVPRYDVNSGTLRMKFYNQRVRQSSSKNMIFTLPFQDGEDVLSDKEGAIMQFGKLSPGNYSLDFTFPLAPVQALGICLTLFNWQVPTK